MIKKTMLLLFNPKAGKEEFVPLLYPIIEKFTHSGFEVTVHPTLGKKDAYEVALERGMHFDYLVCSGGDGTLNEVVDALMLLDKKPVFGYIPSGTTNDFAASLGIPRDMLQAAEAICSGTPQVIDIGQFGEEYFSYVAAFGLFTDVAYGTPQGLKNMLGHMAYVLEGVKRLANIQAYRCHILCDNEEIDGEFIFGMVTNSASVGGFMLPLEQQVSHGDGAFSLILLKQLKDFSELSQAVGAILRGGPLPDAFILRSTRKLHVHCETPLEWTLDGEYGGSLQDVAIDVHEGAIQIMVPKLLTDA